MGIIYQAYNTINGMLYIGKTTQKLRIRANRHCVDSKNGSDTYFHRAIRKYGCKVFEWRILQEVDDSLLNATEIYYIDLARDQGFQIYNMTDGGDGAGFGNKIASYKHSEEQRKNRSIQSLGNTIGLEFKKSKEFRTKKALAYSGGKIYTIIDPNGNIYTDIIILSEFCRNHGLPQANMQRVVTGKVKSYKGWKGFYEYKNSD